MRYLKFIGLLQIFVLALLSGCGGVGDNSESSGTLVLTVTNTTPNAGTAIPVSAQYGLVGKVNGMNGLKVTFSSPDHPELIAPNTAYTDSSGLAQALLQTNGSITKPVTLQLIAKVDDLLSLPVSITLNPVNIDLSLGTLAMKTTVAAVNAGASFSVGAQYTHPYVKDLHGITVTFSSDRPDIVAPVTGVTDPNGLTVVNMVAKNVVTTPTTVNITATVANIVSAPAPLLVNPPTLVLSPPASATFNLTGAPEGAVARFVVAGANVVIKDAAGNPIQNQAVTISVQTIVNQVTGDDVVFFPDATNQIIAPPGILVVTTDSTGTALIPLAVDIVVPAPATGSQHVIGVFWNVSASTPGGILTGTASTLFTVTNAPAAQ